MFEIRRIFSSSVFEASDIEAFHAFAQNMERAAPHPAGTATPEKEPCACGDQGARSVKSDPEKAHGSRTENNSRREKQEDENGEQAALAKETRAWISQTQKR
jgi:uncharacterized protein YecT (DUF1311 family)